jgi:hypothetical protein
LRADTRQNRCFETLELAAVSGWLNHPVRSPSRHHL